MDSGGRTVNNFHRTVIASRVCPQLHEMVFSVNNAPYPTQHTSQQINKQPNIGNPNEKRKGKKKK